MKKIIIFIIVLFMYVSSTSANTQSTWQQDAQAVEPDIISNPLAFQMFNNEKQPELDVDPSSLILLYGDSYIVVSSNKADNLVTKKVSFNQKSSQQEIEKLSVLPNHFDKFQATILENKLYLVGYRKKWLFYSLDLQEEQAQWQSLPTPVSPNSAVKNVYLAAQSDGEKIAIYSISQLSSPTEKINVSQFLSKESGWKPIAPANQIAVLDPISFSSAFAQSHILVMTQSAQVIGFNTVTKAWSEYHEASPYLRTIQAKLVGTELVASFNNSESGSDSIARLQLKNTNKDFGLVNMLVLVVYLLAVVAVGLFFMFKNKNTDDYFRGGQSIPWWAAACSIYATMLSSLTYIALPAVVYRSDWVLLLGIWMIIAVAPIAVYVAIPFFRQLDATSAYEYLSKRFNLPVRLFASGLFTLFHVGRMGIVMALTALALSAVTPLSAAESVLIMGVLCLLYCTLGGVEAVIWTDTVQTIVLLIGAFVCFAIIIMGLDGGFTHFIEIGIADNKFTFANVDFSLNSITTLSIWVIVIGGIGQNISSYTADQAVVQRYMVTESSNAATKSIWANAWLAAPGALLFFCIGTGLYVFYQQHPEKLDPSLQIDQIFPAFISNELPIGVAGLIIAGIFAAAQSTVSTSMNSIATTVVTDFVRPFQLVKNEKSYMKVARALTFLSGLLGTLVGLIFIDPEIRSLMEAYFKVIGMFMGALGGIFVLGALTKRANSLGAIVGLTSGVLVMISAWQFGWANGYLYGTIGILTCLIIGYVVSLISPQHQKDLNGLTLFTMNK